MSDEQDPKFGEDLEIIDQDRLNVLDAEQANEFPSYVKTARRIRSKLIKVGKESGWPKCPQYCHDPEELFEKARDIVTDNWTQETGNIINSQLDAWTAAVPNIPENQDLIIMLKDRQAFDMALKIRQLEGYKKLRYVLPEAWRTVLLISAERQMATIALLHHWLKFDLFTKSDQPSTKKMGFTKNEWLLFIETAALCGKYTDQAYIKQNEYADSPGGSSKSKSPKSRAKGSEYVYDFKTYKEMFPFEWPKLVKRFEALATRVSKMLEKGELPGTYADLPAYLKAMAVAYNSDERDPERLAELWDDLDEQLSELIFEGCPLMVVFQNTQSVAGEANKTDVELRLGLKTTSVAEMEKSFGDFDLFIQSAQQVVDDNKDSIANKDHQISPVILNFQPFAFGSDLHWTTQGESRASTLLSHMNAISDVALLKQVPLLRKVLDTSAGSFDEKKYMRANTLDVALHEIAHQVLVYDDEDVIKRTGVSPQADALDELRADAFGMSLLEQSLDDPELQIDLEYQFMAKLGTVLDYLANKSSDLSDSGGRYYYAGAAIMYELLHSDVLEETSDGRFKIVNPRKGIEIIANLGREVLNNFYADTTSNSENVNAFVDDLVEKSKDTAFQAFLSKLH